MRTASVAAAEWWAKAILDPERWHTVGLREALAAFHEKYRQYISKACCGYTFTDPKPKE